MHERGLVRIRWASMTASSQLVEFARTVSLAKLPPEVVRHGKRLVLDQLGVQIHASKYSWSQAVQRAIGRGGPEESTVVMHSGPRTSAEAAAFVNAAYGHGIEFDDVHSAAMTHPGCVVIPAAVAVAEASNSSGEALFEAIVAGFEVMLRIAWSVSPNLLARGHHSPPAAGPFGAAVASGRLLGLAQPELEQSFSIASSYAGGLMEYTQSGGSVKRIHASIPAQAGIQAARLAAEGVTGPSLPLEGKRGFMAVFADVSQPERLTSELGSTFLLESTSLKAYACNASIHPALEALDRIMNGAGLQTTDISHIEVGVSKDHVVRVGAIRHPRDLLGAQFSLPFSIALRLVAGGNDPADYAEERLGDPTVQALEDLVSVVEDELAEKERGKRFTAVVTLTTTTGHEYRERVTGALGTPDNPMSTDQVDEKFHRLADPVIGAGRAAEVTAAVHDIERIADVSDLTALLRG